LVPAFGRLTQALAEEARRSGMFAGTACFPSEVDKHFRRTPGQRGAHRAGPFSGSSRLEQLDGLAKKAPCTFVVTLRPEDSAELASGSRSALHVAVGPEVRERTLGELTGGVEVALSASDAGEQALGFGEGAAIAEACPRGGSLRGSGSG
jgi:hypothetical protein